MRRPTAPDVRLSVFESALMAAACVVSYWPGGRALAARALNLSTRRHRWRHVGFDRGNCRDQGQFLPFHPWALALLIGVSALIPMLIGRPGDAAAAAITTAVLLALAGLNPQHAWEQPVLRLADTIVGVVVGVAAAWLSRRVLGHLSDGE